MWYSSVTHHTRKPTYLRLIPLSPCPTNTTLPKGKNVVSVKGGCIDGLDWAKAIHIWTKSAMVPIPEGSESYEGESEYTNYCTSQESLDQPIDLRGSGGTHGLDDVPMSGSQIHELGKTGHVAGVCDDAKIRGWL